MPTQLPNLPWHVTLQSHNPFLPITAHLFRPAAERISSSRCLRLGRLQIVESDDRLLTAEVVESADGGMGAFGTGSFVRLTGLTVAGSTDYTLDQALVNAANCVVKAVQQSADGRWCVRLKPFNMRPAQRPGASERLHRYHLQPPYRAPLALCFPGGLLDESIGDFVAQAVDEALSTALNSSVAHGWEGFDPQPCSNSGDTNWCEILDPQPCSNSRPTSSGGVAGGGSRTGCGGGGLSDDRDRLMAQLAAVQWQASGCERQGLAPDQLQAAVEGAAARIQLIQGPPGTGDRIASWEVGLWQPCLRAAPTAKYCSEII